VISENYSVKEEWLRHYSCWPLPWLTICAVSIEFYYYIYRDSSLIWKPKYKFELHRWFTYSFLHVGPRHFFTNVCFQIILGLFVEYEHKSFRMFLIYFIGVVSGSLMHSVMDPVRPLCGASGGIYAIIGMSELECDSVL